MSEPTTEDLAADIADIRRCLYHLHLAPATMSVEGLLRGYDTAARELEVARRDLAELVSMTQRTHGELRALREALEDLWATVPGPAGIAAALQPETIELCKANHELLNHSRRAT